MANLSHYESNNLAEVHNQDNVTNNLIHHDVHATSTSERSNILNHSDAKITSDSNIISYSQYMNESQYTSVQNSSSPAQQDNLILYVIEQLKTQVVNCTKINQDNKNVNEFLTAELERYKDQSKHINIRYHFIKEQVENGVIELYFVNTEYQLADLFTKSLSKGRIEFLINKMGMRSFTTKTLKQLMNEVDE
uniref:Retrovirus-related Pol polyprotein from transposon TNT 1-94 n=1 Tax=Tanacetum cinerariifolium TaxID=118510 RepID=A0A699KTE2_TANCI|nr:retrovirus-related Pol polyprotein from transposon TNT 1-94 [Tanacetum cinerariifolium]